MTNIERIEAYFDNQLSTTEKESLLREIESDANLKAEFEFQQEVVEGLQAYRKQELINRLNTVEVVSVGTSTLTKILGLIGLMAIVSGGLFWYYGTDDQVEPQETSSEVIYPPDSDQDIIEVTPEEKIVAADEMYNDEEPNESVNQVVEDPQEDITTAEVKTPEVNVPLMTEPDSEGIAAVDDNYEAPESLRSESISVSSSADVVIKVDKNYKFHYQVLKGDLTLYGEFDDSKFEVIELKTNLGIKLYLYYNQRYFELKSDSEDIRPLTPIDNQGVIEELDKRRL